MDEPNQTGVAASLQSIASQLRALPARRGVESHVRGFGLIDSATLAGRLLLEAHRLGAFASAGDAELRTLIDAAMAGELEYQRARKVEPNPIGTTPPLPWHAFVAAARLMFIRAGKPYNGEGFGKRELLEGCPQLADVIDQRASVMMESSIPTTPNGTFPNGQVTPPSHSWISRLRQIGDDIRAAPTPDTRPVAIDSRMSVETRARAEAKAQVVSDRITRLNLLFSAFADLLREQPALARSAGVTNATLAETRSGFCHSNAVKDLTGEDLYLHTESVDNARASRLTCSAINLLLAEAGKSHDNPLPKPATTQKAKPNPTDRISQVDAAELVTCSEKTIGRRINDGTIAGFGAKGARKVSKAEVLAKADAIRERKPRKSART